MVTVEEIIEAEKNQHRVIIYHSAKLKSGKLHLSDDAEDSMWIIPTNINNVKNLGRHVSVVLNKGGYL